MSQNMSGPADTRMMGVVHSALRRDLVRARLVVRDEPSPDDARRLALADHLLWMMDFLHHHHAGEDVGLYPLVVRRNAEAAALVGEMDAEHGRIGPAITELEVSARAYRDGIAGADERLLDALTAIADVLLPHLEREEVEMMPVVSASITAAEWGSWDQETNVKPKGLIQLGNEGHWLLDGLDDEGRELVVGLVPPIPRFILLRGFAGRYRRRKDALWGGTPAEVVPSLSLAVADKWSS